MLEDTSRLIPMKTTLPVLLGLAAVSLFAPQPARAAGYSVVQTAVVGGEGGFDYVYADAAGRRLYIPRMGEEARITVFDLDSLKPVGEIAGVNAHGVAVDPSSHLGFSSSNPVAIWDNRTLAVQRKVPVTGRPDGILFDPFNERVWIFSHKSPNATVLDGKTGDVVGTFDLGGEPEQAASDGRGRIYVDLEDKDGVAVIDAAKLAVTATYGLGGKGGGPGGLALDAKSGVLFVTCHEPASMVFLSAADGSVLGSAPIGRGTDGALYNPTTHEAFSSNGQDGTLSVIREEDGPKFTALDPIPTMGGARTSTLDPQTGRIFLISAKFGPAPSPAPGERWARRPMLPGTFTILAVAK
jgi:DNA-binding beta-propeller fold protein YncE